MELLNYEATSKNVLRPSINKRLTKIQIASGTVKRDSNQKEAGINNKLTLHWKPLSIGWEEVPSDRDA